MEKNTSLWDRGDEAASLDLDTAVASMNAMAHQFEGIAVADIDKSTICDWKHGMLNADVD